ncbi:AraC family transcriptional regulator [Frankia sp. CcI49]|uniref:TatD family hydrolase n=1 Tax=unclassified Frankia TaxID=2632575 RepID=UPI0006CA3C92|nr:MULTISPECIES: TatD family hydrolase [unclassified Frankia]KPM57526.1 AraC family transcriptional regulator [Frankia sp. R43]ONH57995.1 AraC family transcriptional regulator [Frankia sp. CcI49]
MARNSGRVGDPPPPPEPLAVPAVDAHCHLDLMDASVDEAIAAALAVGITRMVTVGIDLPTSRWQAEIAAAHPEVRAAVAIHPNEAAAGVDEATFEALTALARADGVVAVGETGLDYYRTPPEQHAAQQESFRRHIAIAKDTGRALMIHDREAHEDTLRILAEEGAPERVVFHAFSGDAEMAKVCADAGYVMSFAGNVTFKNAEALREAATVAPQDLLLVETDAPYLTPVPWRGRPGGPYLVPLTLRLLAQTRGTAVDEFAAAIAANAERTFGPW